MIDCPRCGFTQPPDRYCANCGIDMEHYKAPQKPLLTRLSSSPWFYIFLIFFCGLFIFVYGFQKAQLQKNLLSQQIVSTPDLESQEAQQPISTTDKKNKNIQTSSLTSQTQEDQKSAAAQLDPHKNSSSEAKTLEQGLDPQSIDEASASNNKEIEPPKNLTQNLSSAEKKDNIPPTNNSGTEKSLPQKLKIQFYSLDIDSLLRLQEIAKPYGDILNAQIFMKESRNDSINSNKKLLQNSLGGDREITPKGNINEVFNFSYTDKTSQQIYGMPLQIHISQVSSNGVQLELEGLLSFKENSKQAGYSESFNTQLQIPVHSQVYIVGLLPHRVYSDTDKRSLGHTPLKIITEDSFKNEGTEFVISFEVD